MMFMMIAAVILYLIRPSSLRRRDDDLNKSSRDDVSWNVLKRAKNLARGKNIFDERKKQFSEEI